MKHVRISVLVPGMVTAEDVYDKGKKLILPKGLTLTDKAIMRLESYDIKSVRIEDPVGIEVEDLDDIPPVDEADILSMIEQRLEEGENEEPEPKNPFAPVVEVHEFEEPSHHEKIQADPKFKAFKKGFSRNVTALKGQLNDIVERNSPINVDNMLAPTMALLSAEENNTFGVFDMLHNMRQFDDLTFTHSMNVALICNVFAKWLGMTQEEAKLATACGMLHDIGKLKIEDSIIKKPDKLTDSEYARIKLHPIEGYKILQHQNINEHIKNSALMHHEKCDGTGYPLKLPADKIDYYAKLVAIADVYDAMTSARVYRGALCPFKVIEIFEQEGLHKYDVVLIMTFLENVINTYIDNRVQLSDGRIGVVKWIDKNNLSKPMIQLPDQSFVELAKYRDLKIERIL
ncbi:MAG: HD-GYP domain-containing protein [Lachnospiraceae bacterium]|nr:HD-GYP domain-containing protein [Lachnospiraceae bacterium]